QPSMDGPKTIEEYVNVWGHKISVMEGGSRYITSTGKPKGNMPGGWGHAWAYGYFIVNEEGEHVYMSDEDEYKRLSEKYEFRTKLIKKLQEDFKEYSIQYGPKDSVTISDREIVPDCFWELQVNDEEVEVKFNEIVEKVKEFKR
ncbi:MAG TPA: hypothetical protein VLB82_06070, partial [Thermodesulfobacteriota bacterium]|nr:hypothetical protein [Thermodesulfobacteriota bacterium]